MSFTIKVRGGRGPMCAEYRCEEHGVFEATVDRDANGDPLATAPCPADEGPTRCLRCEAPLLLLEDYRECTDEEAALYPYIGHARPRVARARCEACQEDLVSIEWLCGESSPWTPSAAGVHTKYAISVARGKNDAKPSRYAMDTRSLGEGQTMSGWRKDRKVLKEELRKARVMKLKAEGPDPG